MENLREVSRRKKTSSGVTIEMFISVDKEQAK
jgi:hypothetical protein